MPTEARSWRRDLAWATVLYIIVVAIGMSLSPDSPANVINIVAMILGFVTAFYLTIIAIDQRHKEQTDDRRTSGGRRR